MYVVVSYKFLSADGMSNRDNTIFRAELRVVLLQMIESSVGDEAMRALMVSKIKDCANRFDVELKSTTLYGLMREMLQTEKF